MKIILFFVAIIFFVCKIKQKTIQIQALFQKESKYYGKHSDAT